MAMAYLPRQLVVGEGSFKKITEFLDGINVTKPFIVFSESALKASKGWLSSQLS